jgi:Tol biopolymer transport system component
VAAPGKQNVTVVTPGPGGGTSSAAAFTVAPDTIVFQSARALDSSDAENTNGTYNVWIMNPDGSGATPLTTLTATDASTFEPAWSPDGSKIAFVSHRALDGSDAAGAGANLWVMNADGSNPTPLTHLTTSAVDSGKPTWSPDGSKIAYFSERALDLSDSLNTNSAFNLWVMNADGSGQIPLSQYTVNAVGTAPFAWSPDSGKVAFSCGGVLDGSDALNKAFNIWVANGDGSGVKPLTRMTALDAFSGSPAWSPDGTKIAFFSARAFDGSDAADANFTANIWVMNGDGSGATPLTKLTTLRADSADPKWSPDGSKIAFGSIRALDGTDFTNTAGNIWVMNADGSGVTPLTDVTAPNADVFNQVWLPGGGKLLFVSTRALDGSNTASSNLTENIWVVSADRSGLTPLTKITALHGSSTGPNQP